MNDGFAVNCPYDCCSIRTKPAPLLIHENRNWSGLYRTSRSAVAGAATCISRIRFYRAAFPTVCTETSSASATVLVACLLASRSAVLLRSLCLCIGYIIRLPLSSDMQEILELKSRICSLQFYAMLSHCCPTLPRQT